jgi:hypothetical protein
LAAILNLVDISVGEPSACVWYVSREQVPLNEQMKLALPVELYLGNDVFWV